MVEMPWNKRSKGTLSLKKAERILNEDHYGLKEGTHFKYLAVLKLREQDNADGKGKRSPTILCFVGAPGVGKQALESLSRGRLVASL